MYNKTFKALLLFLATNTGLCKCEPKENEGSNSTVIIIFTLAVVISGVVGIALCSFQKPDQTGEKDTSKSVEIDNNKEDAKMESDSTEKNPGKADKISKKEVKSNQKSKLKSKNANKSQNAKSKVDNRKENNKSRVSRELVLKSSSKSTATNSKSSPSLPSATGLKSGGSMPSAVARLKRPKVAPVKRTGTEEILPVSHMPSVIPTPGSKLG